MRLYTRTGATALDDPEFGHFEAAPDGSFEFPDELSDRLVRFHRRGQPMWETQIDQQARMGSEDLARRRDPATLYSAVDGLVAQFARLAEGLGAVAPGGQQPAAGPSAEAAAELAELRQQLADLQAGGTAGQVAGSGTAKPSRSTSKAAKAADSPGGSS